MIAEIDKKLTEQINEIMHHQDFQKLESAWRGLHYLVNNTETDEMLKIRVMNVSKADLGQGPQALQGHVDWDQSPIFKKVYEEEYGSSAASPSAASSATTTSTRRRPTSSCSARWRRSRRRRTPVHRRRLADPDANGTAGRSWPTRDLAKIFDSAGVRAVAVAPRVGGRAVRRPGHAARPGAAALRRQDQPGRGVQLRGGHRRRPTTSTLWMNAAYAMA